ncbi:MAG: hypothetical protein KAT05_00580 [Spirochaetes bacterium]|nr:hypothetical protein [Spirochaetota bacterium]
MAFKESFFFPDKCLLQLFVQDKFINNKNEIWEKIIEENRIELAIGTTEDIKSLAILLDYQKGLKPVALGFEHGETIREIEIPKGFQISLAKSKDIEIVNG